MARLPEPGGDNGTWGDVLNEFLSTVHNDNGTLKDNSVSSSALAPNAVDTTNIQDATISENKLDSALAAKVNAISSGAPDATTSTKGIVQLTGDLGGTATAPTVPGLASKANDTAVVHLAGSETVTGIKAFSSSPTVPTPTTNTQAANKSYVDSTASAAAPDASTSTKGLVQLTGALGGTATAPTVPGLATKEPTITAGTTGQYYRGDKTWQTLDKTAVGLANVDNTSDLGKPVSSATQTALNTKEPTLTAGTTGQYYRGDKSWQTLDKSAVGLPNVDNTSDINKPISSATQTALNAKADASAIGAKVLLIDNAAALPPGTPANVIVVVKS